ncbi:MAG TPA: METTL5 family protein [Candidatus Nanoarchaeia archaeon]|nr:METTL5 family protein [Candidatus Nanoarchaeia archaeon]
MISSQKELAVILSKLRNVPVPKMGAEQYQTPSDIASEILWSAKMQGDIDNKVIADLGAGNGIFGIGASLLGAKAVYFIENDKDSLKTLKWNIEYVNKDIAPLRNTRVLNSDVRRFEIPCEIVIQNPPFGTKLKHADQIFLMSAFKTAPIVYSFHKKNTLNFVRKFAEERKFSITNIFEFDFPLKNTMAHHKKKVEKIKVICIRLIKIAI